MSFNGVKRIGLDFPMLSHPLNPVHKSDDTCMPALVDSASLRPSMSSVTHAPVAKVKLTDPNTSCTCNRQNSIIVCKMCGQMMKGKIMMKCPVHSGVVYLMDVSHCPNCHGTNLEEYVSTKST